MPRRRTLAQVPIDLTEAFLQTLEMPLKIIHPDHTEIMGRGLVLLLNGAAKPTGRDLYTGDIVEEISLLSKSWAIVEKERKQNEVDDRALMVASDSDQTVKDFVKEYGIKCVIAIDGEEEPGITVNSKSDGSGLEEILDIVKSGIEPHFTVNSTLDQARNWMLGIGTDTGRAENSSTSPLHIIQIGLGPDERTFRKDQIINIVADVVGLINARLGFSVNDERGSSVLD